MEENLLPLEGAPGTGTEAPPPPAGEAPAEAEAPAGEEPGAGPGAILRDWERQSGELRALYPDFDMGREAQNPAFVRLLRAGANVREAYEYAHRDELLKGALGSIAREVRLRVLRDVAARGRPVESGLSGHAPALIREPGPGDWDRETRERIGREALRGKKYTIRN